MVEEVNLPLVRGVSCRRNRRHNQLRRRRAGGWIRSQIAVASQRLTIAKIGGKAAQAASRQFRDWRQARLVENPNEWETEQWPETVRRRADSWADNLRQQGHEPPVVFFAEYVDLWSFCPPFRFLAKHGLIQMMADRHELFCIDLPFSKDLTRQLEQLRTHGQWDEDRFFGMVTLEAASAWNKLVDTAVLIFVRQVVAGSATDEEVSASLETVPDWIAI